nr:GNAT family N-acetyltransferase [Chloroflexota bacterium]
MDANNICQYLDWDSNFFHHRIAQVIVRRLTTESIAWIMAWCKNHAIDCLYFLADSNDVTTVRLAEDHGFRLVDIRVTLERDLTEPVKELEETAVIVRLSNLEDIPALRAIARTSYRYTRFYYDTHFPVALCDALYETWIERSCRGYADAVWVADSQEDVVGYVSCHLNGAEGRIGLVGVHIAWQGQGIARLLILAALQWFAAQGVKKVSVVTQGRNCKAQRLYQRCGFLTRSVELWYHRWFIELPEESQND